MHVAADCNKNVAIRVELIKYRLDRKDEASDYIDDYDYYTQLKFEGRECDFVKWDFEDDEYAVEDEEGHVRYGFDKASKSKYQQFLEDEEEAFWESKKESKKRQYQYNDESSLSYVRLPPQKPVHCNSVPVEQSVASSYIDDNVEALEKLGYDPTQFAWPDINPKTEEESLKQHLKLFETRQISKILTESETNRVINVTIEQLQHARYDAPKGYKTKENFRRIVNSNLVDSKKSPGHPYQSDGLMTNGAVLKHYGDSFEEVILNEWESPFFLKTFCKAEPHKMKKLENKMIRIVTGMPLHKMIKNQAVFENFRNAISENWQKIPIKYCFSPQVPGHIAHLNRVFKNGTVSAADKTNWDFNFFEYVFDITKEVVKGLSIQPADMEDAEYAEYLKDVESCFNEIYKDSKYRCTNGNVYKAIRNGIMKSGWLLTIDVNSIAQLVVDNAVKVRMQISDAEILKMPIVVGGDDTLQQFPKDFDLGKYKITAKELGFDLSDFEETPTFDGCEFFSHRFYKKNGVWTYKPVRFTKHIVKLRTAKLEDLAMTLSSYMLGCVWDNEKFTFYHKMYRALRAEHPAQFPANLLRAQRQLQYKVLGLEAEDDE